MAEYFYYSIPSAFMEAIHLSIRESVRLSSLFSSMARPTNLPSMQAVELSNEYSDSSMDPMNLHPLFCRSL